MEHQDGAQQWAGASPEQAFGWGLCLAVAGLSRALIRSGRIDPAELDAALMDAEGTALSARDPETGRPYGDSLCAELMRPAALIRAFALDSGRLDAVPSYVERRLVERGGMTSGNA